jgi:DNA-binding transcriptional regulator YiaG
VSLSSVYESCFTSRSANGTGRAQELQDATIAPVSTSDSAWTSQRIQALRHALDEDTATFGARFARSGRTVEDWEQGRRNPDGLVQRELDRLEQSLTGKKRRRS